MRKRDFELLGLLAALTLGCISCAQPSRPSPFSVERLEAEEHEAAQTPYPVQETTREILERTNALRHLQGLQSLTRDTRLMAAAADFAAFMARTDQYGHEADGRTPAERAKREGYDYCLLAENIAYSGSASAPPPSQAAQRLVDGWRSSPGHRKNMLDPDLTDVGIGVARSPESGRLYAVQVFGQPKSRRRLLRITNASDAPVEYALGERRYPLPAGYTRTHQICRARPLRLDGKQGGLNLHRDGGGRFIVSAASVEAPTLVAR
ncbi:CAP domain-containing protein [Thiorhodococcus minor]|uniref:CAP domain-containing protein n=1 Tax=Thiorhodococcus minor TaxID=57489 RepID=A0A6M0K1R2_9GAMM|nr:CAP domain-containing protein [Thiorhodococcus minor]NEV63329.1 CAP domain-containing protein [Thiorhodococcus minor]